MTTKTKRLFIGLTTDNKVIPQAYEDIKTDFGNALFGKWVEKQNLHITIKFLGDTGTELIPQLLQSMKDILGNHSGRIVSAGINAFPSLQRPRILYIANTSGSGLIKDIAEKTESALSPFGFETDGKQFRPHLTICRIKEITESNFCSAVEKYKNFDFGYSDNYSVNLYESRLTSRGPVYTVIC